MHSSSVWGHEKTPVYKKKTWKINYYNDSLWWIFSWYWRILILFVLYGNHLLMLMNIGASEVYRNLDIHHMNQYAYNGLFENLNYAWRKIFRTHPQFRFLAIYYLYVLHARSNSRNLYKIHFNYFELVFRCWKTGVW